MLNQKDIAVLFTSKKHRWFLMHLVLQHFLILKPNATEVSRTFRNTLTPSDGTSATVTIQLSVLQSIIQHSCTHHIGTGSWQWLEYWHCSSTNQKGRIIIYITKWRFTRIVLPTLIIFMGRLWSSMELRTVSIPFRNVGWKSSPACEPRFSNLLGVLLMFTPTNKLNVWKPNVRLPWSNSVAVKV